MNVTVLTNPRNRSLSSRGPVEAPLPQHNTAGAVAVVQMNKAEIHKARQRELRLARQQKVRALQHEKEVRRTHEVLSRVAWTAPPPVPPPPLSGFPSQLCLLQMQSERCRMETHRTQLEMAAPHEPDLMAMYMDLTTGVGRVTLADQSQPQLHTQQQQQHPELRLQHHTQQQQQQHPVTPPASPFRDLGCLQANERLKPAPIPQSQLGSSSRVLIHRGQAVDLVTKTVSGWRLTIIQDEGGSNRRLLRSDPSSKMVVAAYAQQAAPLFTKEPNAPRVHVPANFLDNLCPPMERVHLEVSDILGELGIYTRSHPAHNFVPSATKTSPLLPLCPTFTTLLLACSWSHLPRRRHIGACTAQACTDGGRSRRCMLRRANCSVAHNTQRGWHVQGRRRLLRGQGRLLAIWKQRRYRDVR